MEKVCSGETIIIILVVMIVLVIGTLIGLEVSGYYYRKDEEYEQIRREVENEAKKGNCH